VRLTTSHHKTLLLWNLNRGGQGPIWAVAPLDGWTVEAGSTYTFNNALNGLILIQINANITQCRCTLHTFGNYVYLRIISHLKPKFITSETNFSFYLKGNTSLVHYKEQMVDAVMKTTVAYTLRIILSTYIHPVGK
jgi:hypothetical protein